MLHIVLVEPEIPQNTGNISRTCSALGAALHLVKPLGFEINDKHLKRAGLDYWKFLEIYYYENLAEFMERNGAENLYFCSTKAKRIYSEVSYEEDTWLVFGKETKGLPEDLLKAHYDKCVRIPMIGQARSLNLSNSVAIVAYEVVRQHGFENLKTEGEIPNA